MGTSPLCGRRRQTIGQSPATFPAPANASATPPVPAHTTLEGFAFKAEPGAERPLIWHLAQLARP